MCERDKGLINVNKPMNKSGMCKYKMNIIRVCSIIHKILSQINQIILILTMASTCKLQGKKAHTLTYSTKHNGYTLFSCTSSEDTPEVAPIPKCSRREHVGHGRGRGRGMG